jgi:hypothetical protein
MGGVASSELKGKSPLSRLRKGGDVRGGYARPYGCVFHNLRRQSQRPLSFKERDRVRMGGVASSELKDKSPLSPLRKGGT